MVRDTERGWTLLKQQYDLFSFSLCEQGDYMTNKGMRRDFLEKEVIPVIQCRAAVTPAQSSEPKGKDWTPRHQIIGNFQWLPAGLGREEMILQWCRVMSPAEGPDLLKSPILKAFIYHEISSFFGSHLSPEQSFPLPAPLLLQPWSPDDGFATS